MVSHTKRRARLFFTDDGIESTDDQPMLFVHGTACDSHDWMWQLPHFAVKHRVTAPDLRGHGRSEVPLRGYDVRDHTADLAQLLTELDTGPVVAVGHSLGALVVSALALEYPSLARAVVCIAPPYLAPDVDMQAFSDFLATTTDTHSDLVNRVFAGLEGPDTPLALAVWHRRRALGVPSHVFQQTMSNHGWTFRSRSEPYIKARTCPVLSLHTSEERAALESTMFQDPRSRAVTWEGTGHWPHQERPDAFNALIDDWLASLSGAATA